MGPVNNYCLLLIALTVSACGPAASDVAAKKAQEKRQAALRQEAERRAAQLARLKAEATSDLLDPQAAQFRDLHMDDFTLCGEMNAKNALGGYVGFDRFYTAGKAMFRTAAVSLNDRSRKNGIDIKNGSLTDAFDDIWSTCMRDGKKVE
jgi:hypothetical protein